MEEELEDQEEDIWMKGFTFHPSFKTKSRLLIISNMNLDLITFFQETVNLE